MSQGFDCDVLVIGGGPAGSTLATLLARQGRDVLMVEKDHHPRFHIGESLLPANVALLERLGVRDRIEAIGMPKWGVEFVSPQHAHTSRVQFADAWDKGMPMAWQVRRSEFDRILFEHAGASGARTLQGCRVREVQFDADGATASAQLEDGSTQRWRARYVVDASGRDTLLANQQGVKRKNPKHNSAAIFGHFRGAWRHAGQQEGDITIFWFGHGWIWYIPLADGTTSVGAACWPYYLKSRSKPLKDFFLDTIALAPRLAERLAGAELVDDKVYATGNYSYVSGRCCGERYQMVGDAYAFIDPVFSSGVYLAMASAFVGAELAAATLDAGVAGAARERARFVHHMVKGPREFSWFIFRMTNPAIRELFMHPRNPLRMREAVLSLLAGDIFGRTPMWASLRLFKLVYWATSLAMAPRAFRAWRARRRLIADVGAVEGENVMTPAR